jgi:hypothetical protein
MTTYDHRGLPLRPFSPAVRRELEGWLGRPEAQKIILRATGEQALARAFWRTQTFFPRGA